MRKPGRPRIEIDWEQFDKLCAMQATLVEIASWFNCTIDTIENRCKSDQGMLFSEYWAQKAAKGKISLRRKQLDVAMSGNVSMLIWLGKQYLNQKDKSETLVDTVKPIQLAYALDSDEKDKA